MASKRVTVTVSRAKYLARQQRYNQSRKGAARYKRYEDAHPERATKWSAIMLKRAIKKV